MMRLKTKFQLSLCGFVLLVHTAIAAPDAAPVSAPAAAPATASALAAASNFRISQARAAIPGVAVYLDIRAENGAAVPNIRAGQLHAEIGPYPASARSLQTFTASGEGVAYIFLVDISKSLKPNQFAQFRKALLLWTEKMGARDRAAIVTFGEAVKTVQDFTADKALLKTKIDELALTDLYTSLYGGVMHALDLGRRGDADLPRRRVIVTLTDGVDDVAGGSTREDAMARIKEEPVPIFAIGFAAASTPTRDRDAGFKALGAFAHASGGAFTAATAKPLEEIFAGVHEVIHEAYLLALDCATCPGDGRAYPLRVSLQADNRVLTATSDVRLAPGVVLAAASVQESQSAPPSTTNPEQSQPLWVWIAAGLGIVAVSGFLWLRRKSVTPDQPPVAPLPPMSDMDKVHITEMPARLADTVMPEVRSGIPIKLTAVSGAHIGREWLAEVGAGTVIGRSINCAVVIDDDDEVSTRNSALSAAGGLLFVEDLGSTNGTSVNGTPITVRTRVGDGDLILVGRTELRLTLPERAG